MSADFTLYSRLLWVREAAFTPKKVNPADFPGIVLQKGGMVE
jgi:hypothetical protein